MIEYSELCYAIEAYRGSQGLENRSSLALHHKLRQNMGLESLDAQPSAELQQIASLAYAVQNSDGQVAGQVLGQETTDQDLIDQDFVEQHGDEPAPCESDIAAEAPQDNESGDIASDDDYESDPLAFADSDDDFFDQALDSLEQSSAEEQSEDDDGKYPSTGS